MRRESILKLVFVFALSLLISVIVMLYKRAVPVSGVPCKNKIQESGTAVVDLRDYNDSSDHPVAGAINIPVAYLNRSHTDIPGNKVHVIAGGTIEKNIGIRILRKKGYQVVSYTLLKSGTTKGRVNFELRQTGKKPCETD